VSKISAIELVGAAEAENFFMAALTGSKYGGKRLSEIRSSEEFDECYWRSFRETCQHLKNQSSLLISCSSGGGQGVPGKRRACSENLNCSEARRPGQSNGGEHHDRR